MKQIIRELLEQYEKDAGMPQHELTFYTDERIISKHYGFIKRLVENDKVDLKKANNLDTGPLFDYYLDEDALIMALSFNDEPLKFLISILK